MRSIIIENTDEWNITSYGNGLGYNFTHKPTQRSGWIQDTDAVVWNQAYYDMCVAYEDPASAWHRRTWNECLAELCGEYLERVEA